MARGRGEGIPLAIDLGGFVVDAFISRDHLLAKRAGATLAEAAA